MMQFAQFISIVAHPLFMPVYTVLLIFNFNPYVQVHVSDDLQKLVLLVLTLCTIVLPIITAFVMQRFGLINSLFMKTAEERKWPFLFSILWFYLGFEVLTKLPLPRSLYLLMIGALIILFIAHAITLRWKISIHMLGIGGLTGALIGLSQRFQYDHFIMISVVVLLAGFVGYARLKTNSHNFQQVYAGFIIGLIVEWIVTYLL